MSIAQLASKIEKVKVYAEGSTVRRLASLSEIAWQSENTENIEVEIIGLPLALDDASVRVRVDRGETGTDDNVIVTDVRVGLSVPAPVEVPISDLETSIQTAKNEVDRLTDLHSVIALEMSALNVLNVPDRPIGEEGKAPPISPTGARVALANFKDEQQQLRIKEKRELDLQLRRLTENLADLKQQQTLASNANVAKENELRKTIIARLELSDRQAASLPISANLQLIVEYFVQGAKWTPTYVCRLDSVTNTAAIALRALICQRTGEDWSGVQIELSTATPTGWCELPELPALRLGRSQTFAAKKAWRNPPQGAEMLFDDYDLQRQIAYKAISTVSVFQNFQIPTLQRLSVVTQSIIGQKIEDSFAGSEQLLSRGSRSIDDAEFDELSQLVGSADAEIDAELAAMKAKIQSGGSINAPAAAYAAERIEARELMSRGAPAPARMAARSVRLEAMASPGAMPEGMGESVFDPTQEIKNYGLMRLGDPVDPAKRGKLSLPDAKTIYLESLKRSQMTVNFDLAEVLAKALKRAACQNSYLPDGARNVRRIAGSFDFAYLGTGRVDIPADGQFHSVALLTENAEIDLRYIVVPREDTNVFRIAQLRNPLRSPLLAGSTDVYVDGEYILSTRIDTVPPKGQMELGLGVEQSIKVARNTVFEEVRSGESLVAFNELRHGVRVAIANRLKRDAKIEVRERIPVPQADVKVDVTVTQVAPAWEKYEQQERNAVIQGGYRWQIDVSAGGETELTVDYTIKTFVDNELVNGNRREE
jgi:ribosomal protein L29